MREIKNIVSIYINDILDILDCKHKTELTFRYLKELKEKLGEDFNIHIALMKHKEDGVSGIREVLKVKGYGDLDIGKLKTNIPNLIQSRLKGRDQIEVKHHLVFFSIAKDELLVNENNLSYFYNIDSLLSGSYVDNLLSKIKKV